MQRPYTMHLTRYTLYPPTYTLQPTPYTLPTAPEGQARAVGGRGHASTDMFPNEEGTKQNKKEVYLKANASSIRVVLMCAIFARQRKRLGVRTGPWTGPPREKRAPRVGIRSTLSKASRIGAARRRWGTPTLARHIRIQRREWTDNERKAKLGARPAWNRRARQRSLDSGRVFIPS